MSSGLLSNSEKLFLKNIRGAKPLFNKDVKESKIKNKIISEDKSDSLKERIWKQKDKIRELEDENFRQKYEIKALQSNLVRLKEDFMKKSIKQFSITAKYIMAESKLNQETINKLSNLAKKLGIEEKHRLKILKQLIQMKREGTL